jgi:hypothetical protein
MAINAKLRAKQRSTGAPNFNTRPAFCNRVRRGFSLDVQILNVVDVEFRRHGGNQGLGELRGATLLRDG